MTIIYFMKIIQTQRGYKLLFAPIFCYFIRLEQIGASSSAELAINKITRGSHISLAQ